MTAKKAFPEKSFPATVTFRPDQFATVRRLQDRRKLSETELMDAVWEAPENSVLEIFAADPDSQAGDNDGVFLEVVKLDDEESVVRDRWPNLDGTRHIVRTKDIAAIYRALVDQVEEVA